MTRCCRCGVEIAEGQETVRLVDGLPFETWADRYEPLCPRCSAESEEADARGHLVGCVIAAVLAVGVLIFWLTR